MTTPLPRHAPGTDEEQPYGTPSPGLIARAESGLERFLEKAGEDEADEERT